MEVYWLKKVRDQPIVTRLSWISGCGALTQQRQCTLASVVRSTVYANRKPVLVMENDVLLKRLIDDEHTLHLFYGNRKMVVYLGTGSTAIGHSA